MKTQLQKTISVLTVGFAAVQIGCAQGSGDSNFDGRTYNIHEALQVVDPNTGAFALKDSVSASGITIGSIILETQMAPLSVGGTSLQASDVSVNGGNVYVSYNAVDTNGVVKKIGAVEMVKPSLCGLGLFCLGSIGSLSFNTADIFASYSDGTNLYAVGSTSDESQTYTGRLYKMSLSSGGVPTAVTATQVLNSYAGTGVMKSGNNVYATYGTSSTDSSKIGGLGIFNASTLASVANQALYDARDVKMNAVDTSKVYVTRGAISAGSQGAIVQYNADGSGSATQTINSGGNTIAESKSSIQVGKTLLLASLGDQGFKVYCKSNGTQLASVGAVSVSGLPASMTVTNSVTAIPGYIFAANGEAGVYVYSFQKSSALNSNYCQGVTVSLIGRLALTNESASSVLANSSLSANGVYYVPILNVLGIVTQKMLVVASGNKGVSLINVSAITLSLTDVDDF